MVDTRRNPLWIMGLSAIVGIEVNVFSAATEFHLCVKFDLGILAFAMAVSVLKSRFQLRC